MTRIILALICTCLAASTPVAANAAESLEDVIASGWGGNWRPIKDKEYALAEQMFLLALGDAQSPMLADLVESLDLELVHLSVPEGVSVIREKPGNRVGRGIFVFREAGDSEVILQVPHARADRFTGEIAARWMDEHPFRALLVNTLSRNAADRSDADMARIKQSYFTALARAAMRLYAHPKIVQLHGYAIDKRDSAAGRSSSAILSSGSDEPGAPMLAAASCLVARVDGIRVYPVDIDELGGTVNPVSKIYRDRQVPGFIHFESSLHTREQLVSDRAFRRMVAECLL